MHILSEVLFLFSFWADAAVNLRQILYSVMKLAALTTKSLQRRPLPQHQHAPISESPVFLQDDSFLHHHSGCLLTLRA